MIAELTQDVPPVTERREIDLGTIIPWEDEGERLTDSQFFWFRETLVAKVTKYYYKIYDNIYEDAKGISPEF